MNATEKDWVEEVGAPAYAAIVEMVSALDCDYERLEELRDEADSYENAEEGRGGRNHWEEDNQEEAEELKELEEAAGDCKDQDEARERIEEDPLSLRIFGEKIDGEWEADRFELLLTTGGPAVRIMGELDGEEVRRAWLEVQDWGKPWTQYLKADSETLLAYCRVFYFGE